MFTADALLPDGSPDTLYTYSAAHPLKSTVKIAGQTLQLDTVPALSFVVNLENSKMVQLLTAYIVPIAVPRQLRQVVKDKNTQSGQNHLQFLILGACNKSYCRYGSNTLHTKQQHTSHKILL